MNDPHSTKPKFHGRRRGKKLRPARQALMETLLPRLTIPTPGEGETLDPQALFAHAPDKVWLEIGFGGGEHLAGQAKANPDIGLIGAEVFVNGVASFLAHADEHALDNVRVYAEDVRLFMHALPDACLDRAFLLFPDPWPKKRHADRRFINPANLDEIARLLADGAEFRVATDDPSYQRWTLRHVPIHPAFDWQVASPKDWLDPPEGWVPTRYEQKAIRQGRTPMYFRFKRKKRI